MNTINEEIYNRASDALADPPALTDDSDVNRIILDALCEMSGIKVIADLYCRNPEWHRGRLQEAA